MNTSKTAFALLFLLLGIPLTTQSQAVSGDTPLSIPSEPRPKPIDRGPLALEPGVRPISVTVVLRLSAPDEAEALLIALHTPGAPQFHKFLTADQFVARFAPKDSELIKVVQSLTAYGLSVQLTTATTLKVTGLPADFERAFATALHSFEVPPHGGSPAHRFHAPLISPTIPPEIASFVSAIVGLDSRPSFHPASRPAHPAFSRPAATPSTASGNPPGLWTVLDFASYYDVNPLYKMGLSGKGRTLGIVTLASFTPSDAFGYWNSLGLAVDPNRLQIVNVDGGPGAPSDASDSIETTLDVEQSGGVAPSANIIVYQAPNTNQGWVDAFASAVDSNSSDSISSSWGTWEWFANLQNLPVLDPTTGQIDAFYQAAHELFVRAAIQGQSLYVASGDDGAFDSDGSPSYCYPDSCTLPLSVDYPASDPAATAAGATTLAGPQQICVNTCYVINVPHERVWAWDYLEPVCVALGMPDPVTCFGLGGVFPVGSGGGVSVVFPAPFYQSSLPGVQRSQPGQIWQASASYGQQNGLGTYYALPPYFPGRNLPDISFNGDPDTGYVIWYTSDVSGFSVQQYWGGTSFVAPQLNGVTALFGQELHSRIGLLNFPLYALAQSGEAYQGPHPPLHAIRYGDNWFYSGSNGFNLGVGLGTMDVANFNGYLLSLFK